MGGGSSDQKSDSADVEGKVIFFHNDKNSQQGSREVQMR